MTASASIGFRAELRRLCAEAELDRIVDESARRDALEVERSARSAVGLASAEAEYRRWERRAGRLPGANAPALPGL